MKTNIFGGGARLGVGSRYSSVFDLQPDWFYYPPLHRQVTWVAGGEPPCPGCGEVHKPFLGYGHPPPPGVCCQATKDGGTVCSDGFIGPAG